MQQDKSMTKGRQAVSRAAISSDVIVLWITFGTFFLASISYFVIDLIIQTRKEGVSGSDFLIELIGTFLGIGIVFAVTLVLGMIMLKIQRQTMLGNSLQVEYSDYAWLRDWANIVAADLELPRVEIFITQDPYINAYAFGFVRPYTIVLHSGSIRYLTHDELKTILVHEMAHVKYRHTIISLYLLPFLNLPVLGSVFQWMGGFWQRRAELTADRLALMYMADSGLLKSALIKVHVGPDAAAGMNDVAQQWLQNNAERPMNRFAQTFSNHPFLVRRLSQIERWKGVVEPAAVPQSTQK